MVVGDEDEWGYWRGGEGDMEVGDCLKVDRESFNRNGCF